MAYAGLDKYCDHEWTHEGCGDCDENPGWMSRGGTTLRLHSQANDHRADQG